MSEEIEHTRATLMEQFWADRLHLLADALIFSGHSNKDPEKYEKIKALMLGCGFRPPQAAVIAFNLSDSNQASHCEVNPW